MDDKEKEAMKIGADVAAASKLPTDTPYGLTRKYDRKLYDDPQAHRAFHDSQFGKRQTVVTEDGQHLHRHAKAAEAKYGKSRASYHAAQADHIDPIKNAHERIKKSPQNLFVTDDDLKEVINRQDNFQETSAHNNASKQAGSGGFLAEKRTELRILQKSAQNFESEFLQGASDALAASAIPLVIRGTQDLVRVANGEMTKKEAIEDLGTLGISIAASGGEIRTVSYALSEVLKNSKNDLVKRFANVNQIGTVLVISSIITRATGKYLSGEVDTSGFFDEISESGLSLASGMLASHLVDSLLVSSTLATSAAPVLAAMIASAACSEIYAQAKKLEEEKRDNQAIREIAMAASSSIKRQQEELQQLLEKDHEDWVVEMTDTFQSIANGITTSDISATNQGLLRLMNSFSRKVKLYGVGDSLIQDLRNAGSGRNDMHLLR